jgi:energy-coupling factor transporter ATP-binding protein EcfA2
MRVDPIELVDFSVTSYKNLRSVRVDWHTQLCLFGPNGAGKTNLLEAMALCFGNDATLWQIASRVEQPQPGAISATLRSNRFELPLPPAFVSPTDPNDGDSTFWGMLGNRPVTETSWDDAVAVVSDEIRLVDLLRDLGKRPLVCYHLEHIEGLGAARDFDRGDWVRDHYADDVTEVLFRRRFSRTLVLNGPVPSWLSEMAADLPEAFSPLRRWLDESPSSRSPRAELIELPPADWAPVRVVWMATERTTSEAWFDVELSVNKALPHAERLLRSLDRVLSLGQPDDCDRTDDARFWLSAEVSNETSSSLAGAGLNLHVWSDSDDPATISLSEPGTPMVTALADKGLFARLSAGQRVWTDIGLALGASKVEQIGELCEWLQLALNRITENELLDLAVIFSELDLPISHGNDYWTVEDIELTVGAARRMIHDAVAAVLPVIRSEDRAIPVAQFQFLSQDAPHVRRLLRPQLTVRLYDEPERHMHPAAQRLAYQYLSRPSADAIAISTHSHLFLGEPGWRHLHLGRTPEGTVLSAFDPAQLTLGNTIVREMGLSRGELLGRFGYMLVVEGIVDKIVLTELFGPVLNEAGVLILPLHGINEAKSLVEMELMGTIVDSGVGLLADHARPSMLQGGRSVAPTKEEAALSELRKSLKSRGRSMDLFGLEREDILEYLDDDSIRVFAPNFPGWAEVHRERRRGENIKQAAQRLAGVEFFGRRLATVAAADMRARNAATTGDIASVVSDVVAAARSRI